MGSLIPPYSASATKNWLSRWKDVDTITIHLSGNYPALREKGISTGTPTGLSCADDAGSADSLYFSFAINNWQSLTAPIIVTNKPIINPMIPVTLFSSPITPERLRQKPVMATGTLIQLSRPSCGLKAKKSIIPAMITIINPAMLI